MTLGISLKNVFDLQPWQKMLPPRAPCRRWHNFQHVCYILWNLPLIYLPLTFTRE
ncbi:TPA: hypothetical protein MCO73_003862 [Klebsiella pneumoniae]|nr:hypothetical protein [Klebsiella pneumoniae]